MFVIMCVINIGQRVLLKGPAVTPFDQSFIQPLYKYLVLYKKLDTLLWKLLESINTCSQ